jgi:drug/metabolite transporter (DMT)-like permease
MRPGIGYALVAAMLFGASTPFAKRLVGDIPPLMLAALLYLGAALGLGATIGIRMAATSATTLSWPRRADSVWLALVIAIGGILGPVFMMYGLARTPAAAASLLLNLEAVFTVLLAWFVFRENVDQRIAIGMALIVGGGLALSFGGSVDRLDYGALLIIAATLCWAIDNNLTRKVATVDAMVIAAIKGAVAGSVTLAFALAIGGVLPSRNALAAALAVGFLGYGASLAMFVRALRDLGTARTSAYFSVAPFFGAAIAVVVLGETVTLSLVLAGALMAVGVWLHISERHVHAHAHEALAHTHPHRHDDLHHAHRHDFPWDGSEPHTHAHVHERTAHAHPHVPDVHHRHDH